MKKQQNEAWIKWCRTQQRENWIMSDVDAADETQKKKTQLPVLTLY